METYIFVALCIAFLWGMQPVFYKFLLKKLTPFTLMLFTSTLYFFLMICTSLFRYKDIHTEIATLNTFDYFIIIGSTFTTFYLANIIYYSILTNHESSIISAVICSSPVFTFLFAYLFLKERIDVYGILGIFFIVLGVIFISQNKRKSKIN